MLFVYPRFKRNTIILTTIKTDSKFHLHRTYSVRNNFSSNYHSKIHLIHDRKQKMKKVVQVNFERGHTTNYLSRLFNCRRPSRISSFFESNDKQKYTENLSNFESRNRNPKRSILGTKIRKNSRSISLLRRRRD